MVRLAEVVEELRVLAREEDKGEEGKEGKGGYGEEGEGHKGGG